MPGSQPQPLIFLSYRRRKEPDGDPGGIESAERLRYRLEEILGKGAVFHDNESIRSGKDWKKVLESELQQAKMLIALVHSPWWFEVHERNGFKRNYLLHQEDDWVVKEIHTALQRGIPVLPLVVAKKGVVWPREEEFADAGHKNLHSFFALQTFTLDLDLPEDGARVLLENKLRSDYPDLFSETAKAPPPPIVSSPTQLRFGEHHQFTCDRSDQYEQFLEHQLNGKLPAQNTFFYIHGGDQQAHSGLFQRFVSCLRGNDDVNVHDMGINKVLDVERKLRVKNRKVLELKLPHKVLSALGIPDAQIGNHVRKKDLAFAMEESQLLKDPGRPDKVAFLLSIHEKYWHPQHTRELILWFIEEFCLEKYASDSKDKGDRKKLLEAGPDFYFFFAIEYSNKNSPVKQLIEKRLEQDRPEYVVLLPELDMVSKEDIETWFADYDDQWPLKRERDAIYQMHFGDKPEEMYMEEVQFYLGQIINQINERAKYTSRTR